VNDAGLHDILPIVVCDVGYSIGEYLRRLGIVVMMCARPPSGSGALWLVNMATIVLHRKVNIVALEAHEPIAANCAPGDIAIVAGADGWSLHFVGKDGVIESYDRPYKSYNEALWAAKAAAEFGFS
jgi:hypothetical protein